MKRTVLIFLFIIPALIYTKPVEAGRGPSYPEDGYHPIIGQEAPDFTLKSIDGKEAKLSEFRGKVLLLHFLATFSKASQKQLPQLERLHKEYKESGLVVIGVTVEKNTEKVRAFAEQNQLSYSILLDAGKVFKDYKMGQIPDLCFINRKGIISAVYIGFNPRNEAKVESQVEVTTGSQY
jgi:peroxiredoxin